MTDWNSTIPRRQMPGRLAATMPLLCAARSLCGVETGARKRLGICTYSYNLHWKAARDHHPNARFTDPIEFLEYCHGLGAGGVQVGIGSRDAAYTARLRARAEALGMYLEGELSLPKEESDVARFDAEIAAAKQSGAEVVRTAMLGGRRYETFDSAEAFRRFEENSWHALTLAEPIVKKHRARLAIENHKDRRVGEFLDLLKRISSEYVGACVDFGNNLALLEEPVEVVQALAPFALSTHLKDMAVLADEQGFLLSEVPLGDGFLDLKKMVAILETANPKIQYNLEMITRDPLKVPCLTQKYWATLRSVPARDLAATLALIQQHTPKMPLPKISGLDTERQLAMEDENVQASLKYASEHLAL